MKEGVRLEDICLASEEERLVLLQRINTAHEEHAREESGGFDEGGGGGGGGKGSEGGEGDGDDVVEEMEEVEAVLLC